MSPLDEYITMKALGVISGRSVRSVMNLLGDTNEGVQTIKQYADYCAVTVPTAIKYLEEAYQQILKIHGLTEMEFLQPLIDFMNDGYNRMIDDIVSLKLEEDESIEDGIARVKAKYFAD